MKRLSLLFVCIFSLSIVLSGCNLFVQDTNKYLNQRVTTVTYEDGTTITITKEDLIKAYNNLGGQLEQNGYDKQGALDYLTTYLVNREVMLKEVNKMIDDSVVALSITDYNEMWQNSYKSIISILADYEQAVIDDWKLNQPTVLEEDAEDENIYYEAYKKQAEVIKTADGWKIQTIDNEVEDTELVYSEVGKEVETITQTIKAQIGDDEVLKEAYKRYIKGLVDYEKGRGLSTDSDEVFAREVERIYDSAKENKLIELYTEYYQLQTGESAISLDQVLNFIQEKTVASYLEYTVNNDAFNDDMLESREDAWWLLNEDYFYVTHILVKYSDEQKETLEQLKSDKEKGKITEKDYKNACEAMLYNLKVTAYGEETNLTVYDLRNNLVNALQGKSDAQKADVINEYMYRYNQDEGNKNKVYDYVIGEEDSKMVESFTDASRELYNNGNGQFGDVSGVVESEYGAHIVIYLNQAKNVFELNSANVNSFNLTTTDEAQLETYIGKITSHQLSLLNDRTLFDYAYEKLVTDNFSIFENMQLSTLKENLDIKYYKGNYADLVK